MSKYTIRPAGTAEAEIYIQLNNIANELAEANRLKRYELELQAAIRVGVVYDKEEREQQLKVIKAELEDKA